MRKITKEQAKFEYVQTGTEPVDYWVCSDGREYLNKNNAREHELEIEKIEIEKEIITKLKSIEHKEVDSSLYEKLFDSGYKTIFTYWFKFKSIEEVKIFIEYMKICRPYFLGHTKDANNVNNYYLNQWILVIGQEDDSGDYYSADLRILTVGKMNEEIAESKEEIKKMEESIPS